MIDYLVNDGLLKEVRQLNGTVLEDVVITDNLITFKNRNYTLNLKQTTPKTELNDVKHILGKKILTACSIKENRAVISFSSLGKDEVSKRCLFDSFKITYTYPNMKTFLSFESEGVFNLTKSN